jgi:hypothetical protein
MIRPTYAARLIVLLAAVSGPPRDAAAQATAEGAPPAASVIARAANDPNAMPEVAFRRRYALCIGINGYAEGSGFWPLNNAGGDAIAVAEALLEHCDFDKVLLATDVVIPHELEKRYKNRLIPLATGERDRIRAEAETFFHQAANPDDIVLFYFAGHGAVEGTPRLIAGDYHQTTAPQNVFPVSQVVEWITSGVRAQNKLMIVDACRTTDGSKTTSTVAPGFQQALTELGHRLVVMFGCDTGESSYEDRQLGHGRFSWALIQALQGAAFKEGEEHLLVTHLHEYVGKVFHDRAEAGDWREKQHPMMFTELDYPFAVAFREVPKPQPLNDYEWKDLMELRDRGTRELVQNQLERADSTFRLCLRIVETVPQDDASVKLEKGRLEAQRALALYRLGRSGGWEQLAAQSQISAPENGSLAELDGYRRLAEQDFAGGEQSLRRAINRAAQADDVAPNVWTKLGVCQFHLQQYAQAQESFATAMRRCVTLNLLTAAAQNLDLAIRCGAWAGDYGPVEQAIRQESRQMESGQLAETTELADLLDTMSAALVKLGRGADALGPAERALAIRKKLLGDGHPETEESYERVGDAFRSTRRTHALLIGCTSYPNLKKTHQLRGPSNDVRLISQLLTQRFGFDEERIVRLIHENEELQRPTHDNIVREFDKLVAETNDGDAVFIMLAGHSTQVRARTTGAGENVEVDGLDEVFLPEDVETWTAAGASTEERWIWDDDISQWLKALQKKGADVFFVDDSSHIVALESGAPAVDNSNSDVKDDPKPTDAGSGSLVVLCPDATGQPDLESPMPPGSASWGDPVYGRLPYVLSQVLRDVERPLTYRQLQEAIGAQYKRWHFAAEPYAAGDGLDRVVLGRPLWRRRNAMTVTQWSDSILLNVGSLRGITKGSIVAVYAPREDDQGAAAAGYVEVVEVRPTTAIVTQCSFYQLPARGRGELVYAAMGETKLAVAVVPEDRARRDESAEAATRAVVEQMASQQEAIVRLVEGDELPDVTIMVGPENYTVRWAHLGGDAAGNNVADKAPTPPEFGPRSRGDEWEQKIERLLTVTSRALALHRLAVQFAQAPFGDLGREAVHLRITKSKWSAADDKFLPLTDPTIELVDGDKVRVEVQNVGSQPVDATILYLDTALQIRSYFPTRTQLEMGFSNRLKPGGEPAVVNFQITDSTVGWEEVFVLATTTADGEPLRDFTYLEQPNLQLTRERPDALKSLLAASVYGIGPRAGYTTEEASQFAIQRISWLVK